VRMEFYQAAGLRVSIKRLFGGLIMTAGRPSEPVAPV
jgi:hypothetical protein